MDEPSSIDDLLYDCEPLDELQGRFPQAQIEKVWDDIHGCRLEVHIPECTKDEWWEYLIREGWHGCSLAFQISLHEDIEPIKAAMERIKLSENKVTKVSMSVALVTRPGSSCPCGGMVKTTTFHWSEEGFEASVICHKCGEWDLLPMEKKDGRAESQFDLSIKGRTRLRPPGYESLDAREQREVDKALGLLDSEGEEE